MLLRDVPAQDLELSEIADRTPAFVRADLAALVRRAALRAAARASEDGKPPSPLQDDFGGADGDPAVVTVGHRGGSRSAW